METQNIINFPITSLPRHQQMHTMVKWAKSNLSKVVYIANIPMLIEANRDPYLGGILHRADFITSDEMLLVWMLRFLGTVHQDRMTSTDLLKSLCQLAVENGVSVYFLGSQAAILAKIKIRLEQEFPNLMIAGMDPLPLRPLTFEADQALIRSVNQSGAGFVFVSLGYPRQEVWMSQHKGKISAVMIGLGGTFPAYAGIHRRAPKLLRQTGLEWGYSFIQAPHRLWNRYATTMPAFLWLIAKQILVEFKNVA